MKFARPKRSFPRGSIRPTPDSTVSRRQVEGELRLGTEIATLTGVMRDLRDKLIEDHALRHVVMDHERRLTTLETAR